jgi:uncharacterized protein (TIGR00725 family)
MVKSQIAIIGTSRISKNDSEYQLARELGKLLADGDFRILCGGLGGVMEAVCEGAKLSDNFHEGMTVGILPSYDSSTANSFVDIKIASGIGIARNQIIIASADVVVSIGGGAGTLSELAFSWQLNKPIIALRTTGGWSEKLSGQKIDSSRLDEIYSADTTQNVIDLINSILRNN